MRRACSQRMALRPRSTPTLKVVSNPPDHIGWIVARHVLSLIEISSTAAEASKLCARRHQTHKSENAERRVELHFDDAPSAGAP